MSPTHDDPGAADPRPDASAAPPSHPSFASGARHDTIAHAAHGNDGAEPGLPRPDPASAVLDSFASGTPELSFLTPPLPSVPAFPLDALTPGMGRLVAALVARRPAPPEFHATALLATLSGAIGTAAHLRVTPAYGEPLILWGVMIAPPYSGKSAAAAETADVLAELAEAPEQDAYAEREAGLARLIAAEEDRQLRRRVRAAAERGETFVLPVAASPKPEPAALSNRVATSSAISFVGILSALAATPRGLLLTQSELAGLLGSSMARSPEGRALLLQGWDGTRYRRTVHGRTDIVRALQLALVGGTQPDRVAQVFGGSDDGFVSRCLISWPTLTPQDGLPDREVPAVGPVAPVLQRLLALPAGSGSLGGAAIQLSEHARRPLERAAGRWLEQARAFEVPRLAAQFGRARTQALRLAGVLEVGEHVLAERPGLPRSLGDGTMRAAIALLDAHYLPSAERLLAGLEVVRDPDVALRRIARFVATRAEGGVVNQKAMREARGAPFARDHRTWEEAFDRLRAAGCLAEAPRRQRLGRARGDYVLHPAFMAAVRVARGQR